MYIDEMKQDAPGNKLSGAFFRKGAGFMRKARIIFVVLFLMLVSGLTAYAGTINPEEARIIDAASGYFDYQGEKYVSTASALSQMTAYLNQDGVDLVKTQADRAIQLMFYEKNIKTAIDGGYIVPADGGAPGTDPGDGDGTGGDGDGTGGNGTGGDGNGNGTDGEGTIGPDGKPVAGTGKPGFFQIMTREGLVKGFDSEGTQVFAGSLPIKNTGMNLSIFLIPVLILAALASGFLVKVKKEIRFIVVPLVFVLLLAGVLGTVGASAKNMLLAHVETAMILGAPEIDYLPEGMTDSDPGLQSAGILKAGEADIPAVGAQYGKIFCNEIDLAAPLYFGDDDTIFEKGAGQYVMSGIPGEGRPILIGGHDVSFFAPLENIKKGDEVSVVTDYGQFTYTVREIKIESVDEWSDKTLEDNQETLILYTCYPFGNVFGARADRYYVICDKTMGPVIPDASLNR
jgi:sortase A